ncbi:hypothetical protein [Streptomyces antibioticus]|uniref:hypothetical protein n=1 Tax=Streptomyces antibioticus TaxID=1890 RepID=UPI0033A9B6A5
MHEEPPPSPTAPEPAEHARFTEHLHALATVRPAEEAALIHRILTEDPDRTMARSAVLRHLDRRGEELREAPEPARNEWRATMTKALTTADDPFLTDRLADWTFLHTLPEDPTPLATASTWLQRRLAETPGTPTPLLAHLSEHGRTRRIRTTAARALQLEAQRKRPGNSIRPVTRTS